LEIDALFIALGKLSYRFIILFKPNNHVQYQTLKDLFEQQYSLSKEKIVFRLKKISAKSIQSPHDIDGHYRNKDGNKVKGYSANINIGLIPDRYG